MDIEELGAFKGDTALLAIGRVDSYDSESHSVYVRLMSWQMPFPARILINGNCDGVRIDQQPVPIRGTWGLVAFPMGDYRNALWLGAFVNGTATTSNAQSTDSINSSSSDVDSQMRYFSHFSGYYELLDSIGNFFARYPDGTKILANSDDQEPITYRHVVDSEGVRQRVVFDDSYRTPTPPNPFFISVQHPTETYATITPSGVVSIKTGPGGSDTPTAGPVLELNPLSSSADAPQGTPTGGLQLIGQAGNSDVFLDKDGNISIISNGSNTTILISSTGDININSSTDISEDATNSMSLTAGTSIDVTAGSTASITASTSLTLVVGGNSIVILPNGAISITSSSGSIIFMGTGGFIHLTGAPITGGISMTAPPGTITANGNVLG